MPDSEPELYDFLSDQWFERYNELRQGVEVTPAYAGVIVNLRVRLVNQSKRIAHSRDGILYPGAADNPQVSVAGNSEVIEKIMVKGDLKAALPALMTKKITIEGDQKPLMHLATTRYSDSQKELGRRISEVTRL